MERIGTAPLWLSLAVIGTARMPGTTQRRTAGIWGGGGGGVAVLSLGMLGLILLASAAQED